MAQQFKISNLFKILLTFFVVFCFFVAQPHSVLAADNSTYANIFKPAEKGNIQMRDKGTYTDIETGYYLISSGKDGFMATYKVGPSGDHSDDDLVAIHMPDGTNKTKVFYIKDPENTIIPKSSPAEKNALAYFTGDPEAVKKLVYSDSGAVEQTGQRAEQLANQIRDVESQINELENKEGRTDEDDAKLAQLQEQDAKLRDEFNANAEKGESQVQTKMAQDKANTPSASDVYCLDFFTKKRPTFNPTGCAAMIGQKLLQVSAWILWLAAQFFDLSLNWGLNFKEHVLDKSTLVDVGWKIFRDLSNIFFIFVLLLIAIGTIIGTDIYGTKSLLAKVIFAAIIINFSLFITKAIVDMSNIMALQFYGQMRGGGGGEVGDGKGLGHGIAAAFMEGLNLETVYSAGNSQDADVVGRKDLSAWNLMIIGFAGSVLILVTAFVFFAGAILFIIRTGVLMILMVTSPIAFAFSAIPNGKGISDKWWKTLNGQALFAPVYMAITYLVVAVISGNYGSGGFGALSKDTATFAELFSGNENTVSLLFQFGMIIFFMVASLIIATQIGAYGGKKALSIGKDLRDWGYNKTVGAVGRATIGNLGYRIANNGMVRAYAGSFVGRTLGGGALLRGGEKLSKQTFGLGSQSFADKKKAIGDELTSTAKLIENRDIRRGIGESDAKFAERKEKIEKNDKARADSFLGITRDADGKASTKGILGLTRASRDARKAAIASRIKATKKAKTKQSVAEDSLTKILGEKKKDEKWDIDAPKPGSKLALLREQINTAETNFKNASVGDEKEIAAKKLDSANERENKLLDRIEHLIEQSEIEEQDVVGAIKDSNKK